MTFVGPIRVICCFSNTSRMFISCALTKDGLSFIRDNNSTFIKCLKCTFTVNPPSLKSMSQNTTFENVVNVYNPLLVTKDFVLDLQSSVKRKVDSVMLLVGTFIIWLKSLNGIRKHCI